MSTCHYAKNFVAQLKGIQSRVEFRNISRRKAFVNGKSYVGVLSLAFAKGDLIEMRVLGEDSEVVLKALKEAIATAKESYRRHLGQK